MLRRPIETASGKPTLANSEPTGSKRPKCDTRWPTQMAEISSPNQVPFTCQRRGEVRHQADALTQRRLVHEAGAVDRNGVLRARSLERVAERHY